MRHPRFGRVSRAEFPLLSAIVWASPSFRFNWLRALYQEPAHYLSAGAQTERGGLAHRAPTHPTLLKAVGSLFIGFRTDLGGCTAPLNPPVLRSGCSASGWSRVLAVTVCGMSRPALSRLVCAIPLTPIAGSCRRALGRARWCPRVQVSLPPAGLRAPYHLAAGGYGGHHLDLVIIYILLLFLSSVRPLGFR